MIEKIKDNDHIRAIKIEAELKMKKIKESVDDNRKQLDKVKLSLINNTDLYNKHLKMDINELIDYVDKSSDVERIKKSMFNEYKSNSNPTYKKLYIGILKYLNAFDNLKKDVYMFDIYEEISKTNREKYREVFGTYYSNHVHKKVLEGFGYKFSNKLGIFSITRRPATSKKTRIDYMKTQRNKQSIINKGLKVYNKVDAATCKANNVHYDGVDHRIYLNEKYYYDICITNSALASRGNTDFKRIEYIGRSHRGNNIQQMAEYIDTKEKIYKADLDIRFKLNILLENFPESTMDFIRMEDELNRDYAE